MSKQARLIARRRMAAIRFSRPIVQTWTQRGLAPTYARECARRLRQIARGILKGAAAAAAFRGA